MLPSDFSNLTDDILLRTAHYSGGAGGALANQVPGRQDWIVQGATPSFSSPAGEEGMNFTGSADQSIFGELHAAVDLTVVVLFSTSSVANQYLFGGTATAVNTFGAGLNAFNAQAFIPNGSSGYTAEGIVSGALTAAAFCWSGTEKRSAALLQGGEVVIGAEGVCFPNWPQVAIARHRSTYLTDTNIPRVSTFADKLLFNDLDRVSALLDTLVGA